MNLDHGIVFCRIIRIFNCNPPGTSLFKMTGRRPITSRAGRHRWDTATRCECIYCYELCNNADWLNCGCVVLRRATERILLRRNRFPASESLGVQLMADTYYVAFAASCELVVRHTVSRRQKLIVMWRSEGRSVDIGPTGKCP